MHSHSPETLVRSSDLRSQMPLKPLTLTSPPQKPIDPSTYPESIIGPKSPDIQVIPLTSPPFRPHKPSFSSISSSPPESLTLPPPSAIPTTDKNMSAPAPTATPADVLFAPSLISSDISKKLPEGYVIRPLARTDYGMLEVLKVLTTVGDISEAQWVERFEWMKKREGDYFLIVVEDASRKIVGTGCVVAERKFIHNLGLVGHIEDIAVAKDQQGKKLGLYIIQTLDHIAKEVGCYKTILDCSEENEGFYLKCGFKRAGLEMSHYH